jgi:hypothetical protein
VALLPTPAAPRVSFVGLVTEVKGIVASAAAARRIEVAPCLLRPCRFLGLREQSDGVR